MAAFVTPDLGKPHMEITAVQGNSQGNSRDSIEWR